MPSETENPSQDPGLPTMEHLDSRALQSFIDNDLKPFTEDVRNLRTPGKTPPALYDVSHTSPLLIGDLAADEGSGGKPLLDNSRKTATTIDSVLARNFEGFSQLQRGLHDVIIDMLSARDKNLTDIDAAKFLELLGPYAGAMYPSATTPPSL
ncbi:type VII secretion system-associated protein [Streptomyces sp. NPDC051664]|uniref:type VII secretion system-associated protein n=1 Tax=Streptomyces sp. NPDC051664 TaxID=3365668 RepID=UPI0037A94745